MNKMKPEIKKLWIEALLSGNYEQGQGFLCRNAGNGSTEWCCLGVLTDLAIKNGVDIDCETSNYDPDAYSFDSESGMLPLSVMEWAGLETGNGEYVVNHLFDEGPLHESLAEDNDCGHTFEQLAATIEAYF
jgi:hypothetical protein